MPSSTKVDASASSANLFTRSASSRRADESADSSSFEEVLQSRGKQSSEPKEKDDDVKVDRAKKSKRADRPKPTAKTKESAQENPAAQTAESTSTNDDQPADRTADGTADGSADAEAEQPVENDPRLKVLPEPDAARKPLAASQIKAAPPANNKTEPDSSIDASDSSALEISAAEISATDSGDTAIKAAAVQTTKKQSLPSAVADKPVSIDKDHEQAEQTENAQAQAIQQPVEAQGKSRETKTDEPTQSSPHKAVALVDPLSRIAVKPAPQTANQSTSNSAAHQPVMKDANETLDDWSDDVQSFGFDAAEDIAKPGASSRSTANDDVPLNFLAQQPPTDHAHAMSSAPAPEQTLPPEARFAIDNHQQIVSAVRGNLLPNGGTMSIRLDPPELGDLQLIVHMRDGVMSAAFQTSTDQATQALSHSLNDLRTSLEASGISVDRLHVEQTPRDSHAQNDRSDSQSQQQNQSHDSPARRDQQRREVLQRMWRKLSEGSDPLDMVA